MARCVAVFAGAPVLVQHSTGSPDAVEQVSPAMTITTPQIHLLPRHGGTTHQIHDAEICRMHRTTARPAARPSLRAKGQLRGQILDHWLAPPRRPAAAGTRANYLRCWGGDTAEAAEHGG
jgi:hypothetical protein